MSEQKMCACGRPLHYRNPQIQAAMQEMVDNFGENIKVTVFNRSWMVPRHFIALHGLSAQDLPSLGFPEITAKNR